MKRRARLADGAAEFCSNVVDDNLNKEDNRSASNIKDGDDDDIYSSNNDRVDSKDEDDGDDDSYANDDSHVGDGNDNEVNDCDRKKTSALMATATMTMTAASLTTILPIIAVGDDTVDNNGDAGNDGDNYDNVGDNDY